MLSLAMWRIAWNVHRLLEWPRRGLQRSLPWSPYSRKEFVQDRPHVANCKNESWDCAYLRVAPVLGHGCVGLWRWRAGHARHRHRHLVGADAGVLGWALTHHRRPANKQHILNTFISTPCGRADTRDAPGQTTSETERKLYIHTYSRLNVAASLLNILNAGYRLLQKVTQGNKGDKTLSSFITRFRWKTLT